MASAHTVPDSDQDSSNRDSSNTAAETDTPRPVATSQADPNPSPEARSAAIKRATVTTGSYSITVRLHTGTDPAVIGQLAFTVAEAGGITTALDIVESGHDQLVIDLTCSAANGDHATEVVEALSHLDGVTVHKVSDRVFLVHLGGKINVEPTVQLRTRDDLSMAYTPGVGRVCLALAENPEDVYRLTIKGNSVAVVTDGSAVLGLGNLGPGAALPVMEGKAALFKRFANINAWPICLDTQDVDQIVEVVAAIAPTFGGINLEDIAAPKCFEVERRLRERLDIPVFHDDQHGTAIVVLAALTNALRVVDKSLRQSRIVISGGGAAGSAIASLLLAAGARDIIVSDRHGLLHADDDDLPPAMRDLASRTNPRGVSGTLRDGLKDADVFIGVSAPGILPVEWLADMAIDPVIFALANPDPEIDPALAWQHAAVVASGRSDYPNQINNVLAFPGVFRGLLDARATQVSTDMLIAAAGALARCVSDEQINRHYIIPSVFDGSVVGAVAAAIAGRDDN